MRLHAKHGVNPTILKCPICSKDGSIALLGAACKDEAPMHMIDENPCDDCTGTFQRYLQDDLGHFIIFVASDLYESLQGESKTSSFWPYFKAAYFTTLAQAKQVFKDCDLSARRCVMSETTAASIGIDLKEIKNN